ECCLAIKRRPKERSNLPAIYVFVGCLSGCVVAAGQHHNFMIEIMARELLGDLPGKFRKESQIVLGINDQRFLRPARELMEVGHGADRAPEPAQALQINLRLQSLAIVARGLRVPNRTGKLRLRVSESSIASV